MHEHELGERHFGAAAQAAEWDGRLLGDDFTVELYAVEPRIDPSSGTPHIADAVLRGPASLTAAPLCNAVCHLQLNG